MFKQILQLVVLLISALMLLAVVFSFKMESSETKIFTPLKIENKIMQDLPQGTPTSTTTTVENTPEKTLCLENETYIAVITEPDDFFLRKIFVYKKASLPDGFICKTYDTAPVLSFDLEATYPIGILENYLVSDAGTAPGIRGIIIDNLSTGTTTFSDSYYSPEEIKLIKPHSVEYWRSTDAVPTPENCAEYTEIKTSGFTPKIIINIKLDLSNNEAIEGESRCVLTQ